MKPLLFLLPAIILLNACKDRSAPDVSGITVDARITRFDQFLFRDLDTGNMEKSIVYMNTKYPFFGKAFAEYMLGLPPFTEALAKDTASAARYFGEFKRFLRLTRPLYDSIAPKYKDVSDLEKELKKAFQYVKYYFPAYQVPKLVTYIGPFDTPGVAVTAEAMAIGLQLFAGKDFSFYTSTDGQELYPMYISRRFERQYIVPNCMKAVAEDLFPDNSAGKSLVEQMVEKGKRWYLLNKFIPGVEDSLITDYTEQQLKWAEENEGLIWNFLLQGTDIYTTDPGIIKNYIGEAPTTTGMPQTAPGNIGQYIGWKIVQEYMDKHPELSPEALMKTEARKIFLEAKYKPR